MNPVEGIARHLYHLVNFYLERSMLASLAWHDMLMAAVWTLNRLPHPYASDPAMRMSTAFEKATGTRPDLSLMRCAPGALVGCLRNGSKSSSLNAVSELGYFVGPDPASAGCLSWCGHSRMMRSLLLTMSCRYTRTRCFVWSPRGMRSGRA
jgi:hypothetical protein